MATFVLVHGSFHGGWCWQRLVPLLRQRGHETYTPTLTGLGDRAHLASPDVGLETHITDIIETIRFEGLRDVILVGHSYGAIVVTGVADRIPERLARVVLLDGGAPRDGTGAWDVFDAQSRDRLIADRTVEWQVPPVDVARFGVTDPADIAWMTPLLTPHPFKAWTDRYHRTNPAGDRVPRTLICCTDDKPSATLERLRAIAAKIGADYREIATGHDAMVTAPAELADRLDEAAQMNARQRAA